MTCTTEQKSIMMNIRRIFKLLLSVFGAAVALVLLYYANKVLFLDSFVVKGKSMEPVLHSGERVWANKLKLGARIYTDYDFTKPELSCFRLPGFSKIRAGDLVVSNYPYARSKDTITFKINYVYLKRCYATPGDTIRIENGYYLNSGTGGPIGDLTYQRILSETPDSILVANGVVLNALQVNKKLHWTIRNFGPLPVPKKGFTIDINADNYKTWRRLILYESGKRPCVRNGKVYLEENEINSYTFSSNWYFLGGDNVLDSRDSRYFGLVPEDYIIGAVIQ